jgi:hypothetical protein
MFAARDAENKVSGILGDSLRSDQVNALHATSPLPGQFRLIRNGKTIHTSPNNQYDFVVNDNIGKGVYRIEVHLTIGGKVFPWVYTNPIYVY